MAILRSMKVLLRIVTLMMMIDIWAHGLISTETILFQKKLSRRVSLSAVNIPPVLYLFCISSMMKKFDVLVNSSSDIGCRWTVG